MKRLDMPWMRQLGIMRRFEMSLLSSDSFISRLCRYAEEPI